MKLKRVLMFTGPLLLIAGAALAANSGAGGIDASITNGGHIVTNDVGFIAGLGGFVGTAFGHNHGMEGMASRAFHTMWAGAGTFNYPVWAPYVLMSPAALLHPVVHTAIHAAVRLIG